MKDFTPKELIGRIKELPTQWQNNGANFRVDTMKSFLQICVREQDNCSEQFTEILPRRASGLREYGRSDDRRLPEGDYPAFGQIVFYPKAERNVHRVTSGGRALQRPTREGKAQGRSPSCLIECASPQAARVAKRRLRQTFSARRCTATGRLHTGNVELKPMRSKLNTGRIGSWNHQQGSFELTP